MPDCNRLKALQIGAKVPWHHIPAAYNAVGPAASHNVGNRWKPHTQRNGALSIESGPRSHDIEEYYVARAGFAIVLQASPYVLASTMPWDWRLGIIGLN